MRELAKECSRQKLEAEKKEHAKQRLEKLPAEIAELRSFMEQHKEWDSGQFRKEVYDELGESAQGKSEQQQAKDSETVLSNLKGHVELKDGIATLSNISFTEPGTLAQIAGTYSLIDKSLRQKPAVCRQN